MRRVILAACAAACAARCFGLAASARAVPADAEGWYTPPEWSLPGWAAKWSQDGQDYVRMVDDKGKIDWGDKKPSNIAVKKAVEEAVAARCEAFKLQDQIKALGENLAALDWDKMLAEVEDTSSGATASGSVERKVDRLVIAADGLLSGGLTPDGVSVVTNDAGKLALANIPAKLVVPEVFPFWNGASLGWTAFAKLFDDTSLSVEAKADAPKDADGDVQSTSPARSRRITAESATSRGNLGRAWQRLYDQVSIHAPARGATSSSGMAGSGLTFQFTRPRGARPRSVGNRVQPRVSIHAPARGATDGFHRVMAAKQFQFTRPRGARRPRHFSPRRNSRFNSRAREGRDDGARMGVPSCRLFQFTRPRGARLQVRYLRRLLVSVSIHAPARGAT